MANDRKPQSAPMNGGSEISREQAPLSSTPCPPSSLPVGRNNHYASQRSQRTRPLSPPRKHSLGKVAPGIHHVKRVPRSKVHHILFGPALSLSTVLQGIHELSIMLGYEASRDLEEISVQGVRIGINHQSLLHVTFPPDGLLRCSIRQSALSRGLWSSLGLDSRPYYAQD
jgi:hypothetical protein